MRRSRSTTWIISLWAIRTRAAAAPSWGLTQLRTALVTAAPARHEIGDLANRRRIDPDRSPAPDRPDALKQQLTALRLPFLRRIERDLDQLRPGLARELIDRGGAFAGARSSRPAGIALGEAAVGLTKILAHAGSWYGSNTAA